VPANFAQLDWELKAADPPYDTLNELCQEYGLGILAELACIIEAVAGEIVAMDLDCRVVGTTIDLAVLAAPGLDRSAVSIGYRLYSNGQVLKRATVPGDQVAWSDRGLVQRGMVTLEVPPAAVLHCYARYAGVTYQQYWFSDPTIPQNPRRAIYERFDPELELLREACLPNGTRYARELETGVAWLFWMLGFSVLHFGGSKRLQDAPDIVALTPAGHFVVVECTTGQVKGESKLERLVGRTAAVRQRLDQSNNQQLKLLSVMVTSMTQAEVAAGLQAAQENGVVVLAREDIAVALEQTLLLPRADQLFAEAERSLAPVS
jgi:hypothetical protein